MVGKMYHAMLWIMIDLIMMTDIMLTMMADMFTMFMIHDMLIT